jgi:hypothetical protein
LMRSSQHSPLRSEAPPWVQASGAAPAGPRTRAIGAAEVSRRNAR